MATQQPKFRTDLEVVPRVVEGEGLRYIIKDPLTEKIFAFGEEEYFICRQMDGQTSLPDIQDLFSRRFRNPLDLEQLEAFVRYLVGLELVDYKLPTGKPPLHFTVHFKKHSLGNPDRWLQRMETWLSWCFTRTFAVGVALLALLWLTIVLNNFSSYGFEVRHTLWNMGPFWLETFLGLLVINVVGELAKALSLKHYGGNVPCLSVGLAYRIIPTFNFDMLDLLTKKKSEQLKIFSSGLMAQIVVMAITMLGWKITNPSSGLHALWLIFSVAANIFFLINCIPLLPRDGYFQLAAWLEIPDLFTRSRSLVEEWFFRRPLPEPVTRRQRTWCMIFGMLSIAFLFLFWLLLLGILGYCLIWHWNLKGIGACLFLTILGLRYGDNMKLLGSRLFYSSNQEGFITRRRLIWLGVLAILVIIFLIPYPFDAGGDFWILPHSQLSVRAVVPGTVREVMVKQGDWVKKGQTLALLLDKNQQAALESAKESLVAAQEKLALMKEGAKPEAIAKAEQEIKLAETYLHYSSIEADRYIKMFREKSVSEEAYTNKLAARDEARERVVLARKSLELVKAAFRPEQVLAQEAEVRKLKAALHLTEINLQFAKIHAPAEGEFITSFPSEQVGQYLDVGDLLGVIEDNRIMKVKIEVPENDITLVKLGARVKIRTWAGPSRTYIGKVTEIAPAAYNQARHKEERVLTEKEFRSMQVVPDQGQVIMVISEFPRTDDLLHTDMTGYAKIHGRYMPLGVAYSRWLVRFIWVEIWSWLP